MKYADNTSIICLERPTGGASDERLKKDITSLHGVLPKVLALRPVTWRWKQGDDTGLQYGFVAQEVEKLFPEIIKDGQWQGTNAKVMSTHDLLPYAIEAIKEQSHAIVAAEQQIVAFRAELAELKRRLDNSEKNK